MLILGGFYRPKSYPFAVDSDLCFDSGPRFVFDPPAVNSNLSSFGIKERCYLPEDEHQSVGTG
jgi:hypothetical protein